MVGKYDRGLGEFGRLPESCTYRHLQGWRQEPKGGRKRVSPTNRSPLAWALRVNENINAVKI